MIKVYNVIRASCSKHMLTYDYKWGHRESMHTTQEAWLPGDVFPNSPTKTQTVFIRLASTSLNWLRQPSQKNHPSSTEGKRVPRVVGVYMASSKHNIQVSQKVYRNNVLIAAQTRLRIPLLPSPEGCREKH